MHETTSPQIGEHITVFTSVCIKNMQRGDTAGMVCIWALAEFDPVVLLGHQTSRLFAGQP